MITPIKGPLLKIEDELLVLDCAVNSLSCVQDYLNARRQDMPADAIWFAVKGIEDACHRIRILLGTEAPKKSKRPCAYAEV